MPSDVAISTISEVAQRAQRHNAQCFYRGILGRFGQHPHEPWQYKKRRSSLVTNGQIDQWYELGMSNGALGGKLIGVGGGGFLLFRGKRAAA